MKKIKKISKVGGYSFLVPLPTKWIKRLNNKQFLEMEELEDGNLLIKPLNGMRKIKIYYKKIYHLVSDVEKVKLILYNFPNIDDEQIHKELSKNRVVLKGGFLSQPLQYILHDEYTKNNPSIKQIEMGWKPVYRLTKLGEEEIISKYTKEYTKYLIKEEQIKQEKIDKKVISLLTQNPDIYLKTLKNPPKQNF